MIILQGTPIAKGTGKGRGHLTGWGGREKHDIPPHKDEEGLNGRPHLRLVKVPRPTDKFQKIKTKGWQFCESFFSGRKRFTGQDGTKKRRSGGEERRGP